MRLLMRAGIVMGTAVQKDSKFKSVSLRQCKASKGRQRQTERSKRNPSETWMEGKLTNVGEMLK